MNLKTAIALSATVALGAVALRSEGSRSSEDNESDLNFWYEATQVGKAEVNIAQLALKNGLSSFTKDFAQKMIDDHTKANDELNKLAGKHQMMMPMHIAPKFSAAYSNLSKLTGAKFDAAYYKAAVKDHKDAIKLFKGEIAKGKDHDLVTYCKKYLPIIQSHLDMLKKMRMS